MLNFPPEIYRKLLLNTINNVKQMRLLFIIKAFGSSSSRYFQKSRVIFLNVMCYLYSMKFWWIFEYQNCRLQNG